MATAKKETKAKKPTVKTTKKASEKQAEIIAETAPVEAPKVAEVEVEVKDTTTSSGGTAKAGKRSAKALKESEEKSQKEARKASAEPAEAKKPVKKPTRPKSERAGKKYREAYKLIEKDKVYSLAEALELASKTSTTKFDSTVELHINLGVDPRQADQNIRGTVVLPAGSGKKVRVAALTEPADAKKAISAGADLAGSDEIFAQLEKQEINFDVLVAVPALMPKLGKYARLLGPRGLMPNPKSGTVTPDIEKAVSEAKAGKVEYRIDQAGIIHLGIGKASFGTEKLSQNAEAILSAVRGAKPASLKGTYLKSIYISTTMGPSIPVEAGARS